jgi:ABC-2 type transport system ATP-binding protein
MRSGHAGRTTSPVLAAGVGVRRGPGWILRSASFRLDQPDLGAAALGIVAASQDAATTLLDLLAGRIGPSYGALIVLGHDMSTAAGRAAVQRRVGIARRGTGSWAGHRIRGVVEHAARLRCEPGHDRHLLVAAILDRLVLTPWAQVPVRSAPEQVLRRASIAAAAVHQPDLLLIDGLLDDLPAAELAGLLETTGRLGPGTALIVTGRDGQALRRACPEVLALADGIAIGDRPRALPPALPSALPEPAYCD